jgi:hypothetical protein
MNRLASSRKVSLSTAGDAGSIVTSS